MPHGLKRFGIDTDAGYVAIRSGQAGCQAVRDRMIALQHGAGTIKFRKVQIKPL
jgi:hypothetical protein